MAKKPNNADGMGIEKTNPYSLLIKRKRVIDKSVQEDEIVMTVNDYKTVTDEDGYRDEIENKEIRKPRIELVVIREFASFTEQQNYFKDGE